MAQHHKAEQDAVRIMHWLKEHYEEFEQGNIEETSLARAVGLAEDEASQAIDYLENREAIVRFPHPLSTPTRIMLKPGRGWQDLEKKEAGGTANQ